MQLVEDNGNYVRQWVARVPPFTTDMTPADQEYLLDRNFFAVLALRIAYRFAFLVLYVYYYYSVIITLSIIVSAQWSAVNMSS